MSDIAVSVEDVSKRFRLYHEKYQSLKERALHAGRNPYDDFWALRDVAFDVHEGETVGIVGRNGSGKSTLLKCVSGILQPTVGKVIVRGSLAALLELGAGFQPDLTGRENVFLNASLLGLSTREVERKFDEIVAFAELEQFIDNQVRFYSSGMYARLGFAVAVNVDPDVLVIDEVLAVGDENFQRKCLARINQVKEEGRTILFVTHSADLVRQICNRAVVLAGGQMLGVGSANEAVRIYHDHLVQVDTSGVASGWVDDVGDAARRRVKIGGAAIEHPGQGSRPYMLPGEPLSVRVDFDATEATPDVVFNISIYNGEGGLVFGSGTQELGLEFSTEPGAGRVDFSFDSVPLLDGTYDVTVEVADRHGVIFDRHEQAARFEVMNPGRSRGSVALHLQADIVPGSPLAAGPGAAERV